MPELSRFLGIVITMFYRDHSPPHFHASYGEFDIEIAIEDGVVKELMWDGRGCSISQASASMMTEELLGKPVDEALAFAGHFRELMQGKGDEGEWEELGDLEALKGVTKFAVRVKCATLAWSTFSEAVESARRNA